MSEDVELSKKTANGSLAHQGNPGTLRSKSSTEFLLAADLRDRICERALPCGSQAIKENGLGPGCFDQNKGGQAVHFTLVNPLNRSTRLDMEGAQKKKNLTFYQTLNGGVICFDAIPKEDIKKVIHIRGRADTKARIRASVAYILSKREQVDTAVEQKRCRKDTFWRKLHARQGFHTKVSSHFTTKPKKRATPKRAGCTLLLRKDVLITTQIHREKDCEVW